MEKLLLTVWEAADVLSVSRSRVYELLYAEQLDSVKIGRSRRVALVSRGSWRTVRRRHELSRPQGEGAPTGSPGYLWTNEPPDPTSFTLMLLRPAERQPWRAQYDQGQNPRPLLWTVLRQRGTTHLLRGVRLGLTR